jgi:hypothetical protein
MMDLDDKIEQAARKLSELVIRRGGNRPGRYAVILKATVDDSLGNGVMSWDWYWNPDTSTPGDGT